MSGQHDDGEIGGAFLDFPQGLMTVHTGHLDIENHDVGSFIELFKGLLAAFRQYGVEAPSIQYLFRGGSKLSFVINHQDFDLIVHCVSLLFDLSLLVSVLCLPLPVMPTLT